MRVERIKLTLQTVKDNIAIMERQDIKQEDIDAGFYLQLEHEKIVLEALEKQIPQKIDNIPEGDLVAGCHRCGEINALWKPNGDRCSYCGNCGQKIDWSETE